ncbi:MAG TPA: CoA transferase [Henriciella marina]|uniref:CaiB/BaiF CoA transferase family protein n=1 Tax=Henriciella sp. TaxID=1968823 RepID=UPI0017EA415D|nr:CoA transferase [Henriciella sp.]HIG23266.1 CoA transferase [Henriciella sp.]HIK64772.1 CoA transferase [Henriciella marina]
MTSGRMLEGVRVVDMTSVVFGPYATQILADLGADVIKVEPPTGDAFRYSGKPAQTRGMAPSFMALNKGKRSVVLDLKAEEDRAAMRDLLASADIFIHNVRSQAIEKLGFSREQTKKINNDLIYIHCVGFAEGGPYYGLQAYDDVIQAASGTATLAGRVDGSGEARYLPSLIADKVAGLHGAQAAMAAYIHKLRTGESQFVEVPMFEVFTKFMLMEHLAGLTFDPPNAPVCYFRQIDPDRQPFQTSDGFISMVPYTPEAWRPVFDVLGEPEFLDKPEFSTPRALFENQALLYRRTAEITPSRTTAEWTQMFNDARIPCMPVRDMADILEDPHLKATGFFQHTQHPSEGNWYDMKSPISYSAYKAYDVAPPPRLGEHSADVGSILADWKDRDS